MKITNRVVFNDLARSGIMKGAKTLADSIRVTIGPKGRNVTIGKRGSLPMITNDGATIARSIFPEDDHENIGVQIVRQAALKTNDQAGDGTTTSTILAYEMMRMGANSVSFDNSSPVLLRKGIEKATKIAVEELKNMSKPVSGPDDIRSIATISSQSELIGGIIADAVEEIGVNGSITVEESGSNNTSFEVVKGMSFDKGYISHYMITDIDRMTSVFDDAFVLITTNRLSSVSDIVNIFEELAKIGKRELVIIADDIEGEALQNIIMNKMQGNFNVLGIKAPAFGGRKRDLIDDIAIMTNATVICPENGIAMNEITMGNLGRARRVVSTAASTSIIDGACDKTKVADRVKMLETQLKAATVRFDQDKLRDRISKLTGGVAVIKVGGSTEVEMVELKHRVEDAVEATKAAAAEGIVPGGGTALFRASQTVAQAATQEERDVRLGMEIVSESMKAPMRQIIFNAGCESGPIEESILSFSLCSMGYNAMSNEVQNLLANGVIDPVKVERCALENASSVAAMFITTDAVVIDTTQES